ncbi:MAG: Arm DNA-binding domain-containing protein [Acidimicrobiales bacterium]
MGSTPTPGTANKGILSHRRGSSWGYVIDVARDPATGKRRQRTKSGFATKAAAEEAMRTAIAAGSSAGGDAQKLGDHLDEWITAVEPRLWGTTASSYRIAVDRIKTGLGAVRLRDLTPLMIESFYADQVRAGGKSGEGLSAKTVRNTHVVLRKALADGERLELLHRNPAARAKPPTGERKETPTWTAVEVTTFLAGVEDDALYALWVLLANTGLRRGE